MAIVSLQNVSKHYGQQVVLEDVSVQIEDDDKIGLIGANGTGKSTLLRIIAGEVVPDGGIVNRRKMLTVSTVHQDPDLSAHTTLYDYAKSAFDDLQQIQREMQSTEADLHATPNGAEHDAIAHRLAELHDLFESRGGYAYTNRIDEVLNGLGFPNSTFQRSTDKLSGGERTRAALGRAILSEPELLLLDEPTNHLDLTATRWLENYLQRCPHAVIVVSHDRYFLDKVAGRIAELQNSRVQVFKGNYSIYLKQKEEQLKTQGREFDKQQTFLEKEQDFIRRHMAGQRTKEAQGRRKRLERVDVIERPQEKQAMVKLEFQPEVRGGDQVLRLRDAAKRYGNNLIFDNLTCDLNRGERMGVIGPSGAGKTTLIKMILGTEEPSGGEIILGHNIIVGYLAQHRVDLDPHARIIDELFRARPKADSSELRSFIARFLFSGSEIEKRVGTLSGGEQTRVALAKLILAGANFLVLDEPTNHLDIPSRAALEQALSGYDGTILVVSHDRYLLNSLASRILVVSGGETRLFSGGYQVYEATIATEEALSKSASKPAKSSAPGKPATPKRKSISTGTAKKMSLNEIEKAIIKIEAELESLTAQLDDPYLYEHVEKAKILQKSYRQARTELDRLNAIWEDMIDSGEY